MRILIDAIPVRYGGFAVALEGLLGGWDPTLGDELHLVLTEASELTHPDWIQAHRLALRRPAAWGSVAAQSLDLPRICREVGADVLLAAMPKTALGPLGVPKVITVQDLRHELLPQQFSPGRRALRRVSYGAAYRQSRAIACISERTRRDLLRSRPWLTDRCTVETIPFGCDHVDGWPRDDDLAAEGYALTFGHFVNKGVDRVLEAWAQLAERRTAPPLRIVGLPREERPRISAEIERRGLGGLVRPLPWLAPADYQRTFASASLVVFASDFEGFGLPAVEAMRLGIPLVISPDPALLEVTGGLAEVMGGWGAGDLAAAVERALGTSAVDLARAAGHVEDQTWREQASRTRDLLERVLSGV
jgi:glycosyltransferase involved in cell wall biosynthesis